MPVACRVESGGFGSSPQKNSKKVLLHLLIVSIAVIVLDITVIVLEFSGFHIIQISYKELAYSVKLKLEISVLSRLVKFVQSRPIGSSGRITTQDELEWDPTVQQVSYPPPCGCRIDIRNEKLPGGRTGRMSKDAQSQAGRHGDKTDQTHPAQDLTIESVA